MIIALAAPSPATSIDDGLEKVRRMIGDAAAARAEIVCFPEAYLPGLRGLDFAVPEYSAEDQARVLDQVAEWSAEHAIATIVGMELIAPAGRQIAAAVFDAGGTLLGIQTKTQLDPTEEAGYVPGDTRRMFAINGVTFGIAICHEGFRYPETVRWAAQRGARIVFHPHCAGSDRADRPTASSGTTPPTPRQWGAADAPYYEQAMAMRSRENTIYFASVNYGFRYQESATSLIDPSGACQAYLPHGAEGVLIQEIAPERATGLLASRYAPERYPSE
jgi:predicted amidohydrolase